MTLHVQGANFRGNFGCDAARDPGEVLALVEAMGDLVFAGQLVFGVGVYDRGQRACSGFLIVNLGGHRVDGVDLHGHGELVHVAVVENAAARRNLKGALLLFCARSTYSLWRTICSQKSRVAMATPRIERSRDTSQKRASFIGMARDVTVRGRVARRAACMFDQRFEFQIRASRRDTMRRITRCARRGIF